ncbi:MAG TPA: tetratricopeptide repeat protein [Bacteroidia bacterium]|jgi:tetratricopeptide (TPR) repeat protein|nr:tetratricopeptide repeat protein [Bacteroidia bacterium]
MAQQITEEPIVNVEEAFSKTELYIEQNKKSLSIIAIAIVALIGGYFAYKNWYVAGEEVKARAEMFKAETFFEKDSLDLAINGDPKTQTMGLTEIADEYSITPSGNLAEYYLGMCYLKKGQYEEAIKHLEEFDSKDQIVAPIATGAIGDANMELGRTEEAITYYIKAAEQSNNKFTVPIFLKKAGMANEEKGNYADAVKLYERIQNEFAESAEGRDIEKYIARAKGLGNL